MNNADGATATGPSRKSSNNTTTKKNNNNKTKLFRSFFLFCLGRNTKTDRPTNSLGLGGESNQLDGTRRSGVFKCY